MFDDFNNAPAVNHFSVTNSSLDEVLDEMSFIRDWYYNEVTDNDTFYNLEELNINYNKLCALYDRFATFYGEYTNKMYIAQNKRNLFSHKEKKAYTLGDKKAIKNEQGQMKTITRKMTDAFATTLVQSDEEYMKLDQEYYDLKALVEKLKILSYAKSALLESFKTTIYIINKQLSNI